MSCFSCRLVRNNFVKDIVDFRINGRQEPVLLAVDFYDRFVKNNLLRLSTATWYEIGFLTK